MAMPALARKLHATGKAPAEILVVMEATGAYWITLATQLVHTGFQVSVMNPAGASRTSLLQRAKTDAIDAQTLAQLAMLLQPAPWTPPPQIYYGSYSSVWPNVIPCSISSSRCVISSMRWTNCRRSLRPYVSGLSMC